MHQCTIDDRAKDAHQIIRGSLHYRFVRCVCVTERIIALRIGTLAAIVAFVQLRNGTITPEMRNTNPHSRSRRAVIAIVWLAIDLTHFGRYWKVMCAPKKMQASHLRRTQLVLVADILALVLVLSVCVRILSLCVCVCVYIA